MLAWTIRVMDILLAIFSGRKILCTELQIATKKNKQTHNFGRLMKSTAYVSEQMSENSVPEN